MLEPAKTQPRNAAPATAAAAAAAAAATQKAAPQPGEMLYEVLPEVRSGLRLDLRYVLRDANRVRAHPLLNVLNQTIERELSRIRFPAEALLRLANEIDSVADTLPDHSPLLELSERARAFARAHAFEKAELARAAGGPPPGEEGVVRSASEEAQLLRTAAAAIEVSFVTTTELDDTTLAGYLNYCMTLENYDAVIATLLPRTVKGPKVWIWNLLLAAMRLSKHADFTNTAARFHAWVEERHPEALSEALDRVDARRFSTQKLRILEQKELGVP